MSRRWKLMSVLAVTSILFLLTTTRLPDHPVLLSSDERVIRFQNVEIVVEVVSSPEKMAVGLGHRPSLVPYRGMLFFYPVPGMYSFWMKDMQFPLDIIWIGEDWAVADIRQNISPDSYPETFQSSRPAQFTLEVNAGFAERYGIQIGDTVRMTR